MTVGMTLLSLMLANFSRLGVHASFWALLPGLAVGGVGMGMSMTPTAAAAARSVPVSKAGIGSAVLSSMRQVGGPLGTVVTGAIVASGRSRPLRQGNSPESAYLQGSRNSRLIAELLAVSGAIVLLATIRTMPQQATRPDLERSRSVA